MTAVVAWRAVGVVVVCALMVVAAVAGPLSRVAHAAEWDFSVADEDAFRDALEECGDVAGSGDVCTIEITGDFTISGSSPLYGEWSDDADLVIRGVGGQREVSAAGGSSTQFLVFGSDEASLAIENLVVTGFTGSFQGGAIYAGGDVSVVSSTFADNAATGAGGAIIAGGDVSVVSSTFAGNTAGEVDGFSSGDGGAILAMGGVEAVSSTFTGNTAVGDSGAGGAIWASGDVSLRHVTLAGNAAALGAHLRISNNGFPSDPFVLSVSRTVFADAQGGDYSCGHGGQVTSVISGGYNVDQAQTNSCDLTHGTDTVGDDDPLLGELADNGGPTPTMLPLEGSPLIDAIPAEDCLEDAATDQRGVARPQGDGCDIGAVEFAVEDDDDGGEELGTSLQFTVDTVKGPVVVTLSVEQAGDLTGVDGIHVTDPQDVAAPAGRVLPYGAIGFQALVADDSGISVQVSMQLPHSVTEAWKFHHGTWSPVPGAVIAGDTVSYVITDGDPATDEDGVANGVIVDPVGLAIAVAFAG